MYFCTCIELHPSGAKGVTFYSNPPNTFLMSQFMFWDKLRPVIQIHKAWTSAEMDKSLHAENAPFYSLVFYTSNGSLMQETSVKIKGILIPGQTIISCCLPLTFFLGISVILPLFLPCDFSSSICFHFPLHSGLNLIINKDDSQPQYVWGGVGGGGTGRGGEGVEKKKTLFVPLACLTFCPTGLPAWLTVKNQASFVFF